MSLIRLFAPLLLIAFITSARAGPANPEQPPLKAYGVMVKLKDKKSGETKDFRTLNRRFGVNGESRFFKDFNIYSFRLKSGPVNDHRELNKYCEEAKKLPGVVYCELNLELRPDSV